MPAATSRAIPLKVRKLITPPQEVDVLTARKPLAATRDDAGRWPYPWPTGNDDREIIDRRMVGVK